MKLKKKEYKDDSIHAYGVRASCDCTYSEVCATDCSESTTMMAEWRQVTASLVSRSDVFTSFN